MGKDTIVDLYDTVSGTFVVKNVSASTKIIIPSKGSTSIVIVPSKGKISYSGSKMLVNDIVVDYNYKRK